MFVPLILPAVALGSLLVSARPALPSRTTAEFVSPSVASDLAVLKFADVLERIETSFYTQVQQIFTDADFTEAGFVSAQVPSEQLARILIDESTHAAFLNATIKSLGGTPIPGCEFSFGGALADVSTVIQVARVVELTGTGAYLGSTHLLNDPSLLTTAASIATIESRHQSILNALGNGSAIPQSFDVPLLPQEALSLAGGFLSGCNPGVTAFPALSATTASPLAPGVKLELSASSITTQNEKSLSCQTLIAGATLTTSSPLAECAVPENASGPFFVWVTKSSKPLSADVVFRSQGENFSSIVAGPDIVFVDDHPEALASVILGGSALV